MEDEEVRQGIKEYSNWPTFPQLYINGDLVGGLDVMKELHENNELVEMFESADSMKTKLKWLTNKAPVCHNKIQRGLSDFSGTIPESPERFFSSQKSPLIFF